jgi:hypothetical protein
MHRGVIEHLGEIDLPDVEKGLRKNLWRSIRVPFVCLLEPVMHFSREKSVQSRYIPALRLGGQYNEKHIRVMSATKSGRCVRRI